jgi:bifunctional non-homologous end joining protein LigD
MRTAFEPCIPTNAATVPDRPEWIHEVKHDGYRLIVQRDGKRVRLWTQAVWKRFSYPNNCK